MTKFEERRIGFLNSGFVIVSSFVIRVSSFPSFSAKSGDGISFGGAKRRQKRGEQTDYGEDKSDPEEHKWIVGFRAEEERFHQPRDAGGGQQTQSESERGETRALPDDESQNIADLRAERVTNSEFTSALRDAVGYEPVEPDRCEQEREQRKQTEKRKIKLWLGEARFHQRADRRDVRDRLLWIKIPDRALDSLREVFDRQRRPNE